MPRLVRNMIYLLVLFVFISSACSKKKSTQNEPPKPITFTSISPTSGCPGTIVKISGVDVSCAEESLYVKMHLDTIPVMSIVTDGVKHIAFAVPKIKPGNYKIMLCHRDGRSSTSVSFTVLSLPPTGLPPGKVTEEVYNTVTAAAHVVDSILQQLVHDGYVSTDDGDRLSQALGEVAAIISSAKAVLASLPDSEKVLLDQYLQASGLSQAFGTSGQGTGLKKAIQSYGTWLRSEEQYSAFRGLIFGDNLSCALSAIGPVLTVIGVASAAGTLGISAVAVTLITIAISTLDQILDGLIPTDLYRLNMKIVPNQGATLEVGETAKCLFDGYFKTQSGYVSASVSVIVGGILRVLPINVVDKLVAQVCLAIGKSKLEDLLGDVQTVYLPNPIPIDIDYYRSTGNQVLGFVSSAAGGIFPAMQIIQLLQYSGVSFPELGYEPLIISTNLVQYDPNLNEVTAQAPGTMSPQVVTLRMWVINPACEGEGAWWSFLCWGIELPEPLPNSAYSISAITVNPASPHLLVSPASLSFQAFQGGSVPPFQNISITNTGGGTLGWSVSVDSSWLYLDPPFGSLDHYNDQHDEIRVNVTTTNLTPGSYSATVSIKSDADNTPQSVNVNYTIYENHPPDKPSISGPTEGYTRNTYYFTGSATDPDNDSLRYRLVSSSSWSDFVPSGTEVLQGWYFGSQGTWGMGVQAEDKHGAKSEFSSTHWITIQVNPADHFPIAPSQPSGPSTGSPNVIYEFSTSAVDPDGDNVSIMFEWGDGNKEPWCSWVPSGSTVTKSHSYSQPGEFYVRAKAVDPEGAWSPWSEEHRIVIGSIPPSPHIALNPTSLSFSAVQDGTLPSPKSFTITNTGAGTLNWSVADNVSWLDESPKSGSSNSASITVSVNTTNLSAGTYNATITVSSSNANNSPQTVDVSYIVTSTGTPSIPTPGTRIGDLAWDGSYLWCTDSDTRKIYKLNPDNGSVLRTFNFPDGGVEDRNGLTWGAGYLWLIAWNCDDTLLCFPYIVKLKTSDGSVVDSFQAIYHYPGNPYMWAIPICLDWYSDTGPVLWMIDCAYHKVVRVTLNDSPNVTPVDFSFSTPSSWTYGVAWDGNYIWCSSISENKIYKINATNGSIISSYNGPGYAPLGIVWGGGYLWVADPLSDRIYKFQP